MATIDVFGSTFQVDATKRDYTIGGAGRLSLQLNAAGTSLSVTLDGTIGALRFALLAFDLRCVMAGNAVRLTAGDAHWTGTVVLAFGRAAVSLGLTRVISPAPEAPFGVAFETAQAAVFNSAMAEAGHGDLGYYSTWQLNSTGGLMSVDATSATTEVWPTGGIPGLNIAHRFGAPRDKRIQQDFTLERLRLTANSLDAMFWPASSAVFLNPDVLDPTRKLDDEANGLLFQHVAAEAHLVGGFSFAGGAWTNAGWSLAPAERGGSVRLAAPTLKDEHGHPLILSVRSSLPIGDRQGLVTPAEDPGGVTNRGWVIGDSTKTLSAAAHLEVVDAVSIYGASRVPPPLVDQRPQAPYWVQGRSVPLQGARPRQITGFASDATVSLDRPAAKPVTRPAPHPVTLRFAPVTDARGLRFVFPTVEVPLPQGAAPAMLSVELPEQATLLQPPGGAPTLEVSRRNATAVAASVVLPLLDARWAFSDLGTGATPGDGLAEQGAKWLDGLDKAATDAFAVPKPDDYQHIEGLRVAPNALPLRRLLAPAPTSSKDSDGVLDARRIGLLPTVLKPVGVAHRLAAPVLGGHPFTGEAAQFMFGGEPASHGDPNPLGTAATALQAGRDALGGPLEDFFWFWVGAPRSPLPPAPDWKAARLALWDYLVGLRPALSDPDSWSFDDLVAASERLESARASLLRNPPSVLGFDGYEDTLDDALPDEIAEVLDPDRGESDLARLLQFAFAPPTMELANRAIAAVESKTLAPFRPILKAFVTDALGKALLDYFGGLVPGPLGVKGFFAELVQGLPPIFQMAQDIWKDRDDLAGEAREVLLDLADRYGAVLTHEAYAAILQSSADSEAFLGILRDLGLPLARLADLAGEPPDYLIISRRLRRPSSGDPSDDPGRLHAVDRAAALWNHRFDFCVLGGGKAWDLFLDDQTTLIVKLGGARGLPAILSDATRAYGAPGRLDPFGLDPGGGADPVGVFTALLPVELAQADWRGVLIINPKIDLSRDDVLATLCGFSHIDARYAAVGGRKPDGLPTQLDVWGQIERRADPVATWTNGTGEPLPATPGWGGADVAWSLIRFSATVKGATIQSGEIAFRLDIRELFGRRFDWDPIQVAGTLPPTTGGVTGNPRDFTFAATFDTPLDLTVEVAFIDRLKLRGIRVGSHDGDTTLDIDTQLTCRDWGIGGIDLQAPKSLDLSNFRIRMPQVEAGRAIAMGVLRSLNFDLGNIRFPLGDPRRITLAGLDIRPVAVGLLRDTRAAIADRLHAETIPLVEPFGAAPTAGRYAYPYVDTKIEFGRAPAMGGSGEFSLIARVGVPVSGSDDPVPAPVLWPAGVGLASLNGRDLRISLFRLLTLEFKSIDAGVFDLKGGKKAGVVWADGFNLSLLSWSLFEKSNDPDEVSARTLVFAHDTTAADTRGFMAWYAAPKDPGDDAFFRLQWLLISQNIDPGATLKNALLALTDDVEAEKTAIQALKGPGQTLNMDLDKRFGWLFGVRFELGDLFKPCALIFHDGFYYGIRLGGPIAKLLTGEDDISLAYIPGDEPSLDRFRVALRIAALEMMGMKSGEIALEWSPAWDFLIDLGQPWRGPNGYMWERAFSIPFGVYEAKFGFFIEKRTSVQPPPGLPTTPGVRYITLSAGAGFYFGYQFSAGGGIAWVRAGIGVFGVLIGSATLRAPDGAISNPIALLNSSLAMLSITGTLGIYAYGEGGVDVWILSARFRVSAQAFVEVTLIYIPNARSYLTYIAMLSAAYSASVRVGAGPFSWTFSVSGAVQMQISGSAAFG